MAYPLSRCGKPSINAVPLSVGADLFSLCFTSSFDAAAAKWGRKDKTKPAKTGGNKWEVAGAAKPSLAESSGARQSLWGLPSFSARKINKNKDESIHDTETAKKTIINFKDTSEFERKKSNKKKLVYWRRYDEWAFVHPSQSIWSGIEKSKVRNVVGPYRILFDGYNVFRWWSNCMSFTIPRLGVLRASRTSGHNRSNVF